MKHLWKAAIASLIILPMAAYAQDDQTAGEAPMTMNMSRVEKATVDNYISSWMEKPRAVAQQMIEKYGQPHEATPFRLVWWNSGPWKFTMLTNETVTHNFPMPHQDMLWQAIDYNVPEAKFTELANFDGSVYARRTEGELSAKCDREEANFLAVNLSHDIITGKRDVQAARDFYASTIKALMNNSMTDEQKSYTSGFTFQVPKENKGDPGTAVIEPSS